MSENLKNGDELCGVLIVNKHGGCTSFDIVNKVRRLYGTKRVGHAGTLDPMATGVLVVLVGRAAKAAELIQSDRKAYRARMRLGLTTDTEDITGEALTTCESIPDADTVKSACEKFKGEIMQIPPMYSALKVNGQKLCDLARKGITVERKARPVTIYKLECDGTDRADEYELYVECSGGTYIRTLCADIGATLGCGAVMATLTRCECCGFSIDESVTLEALTELSYDERVGLLRPCEGIFSDLDSVTLPQFYEKLFRSGQQIYQKKIGTSFKTGQMLRVNGKDCGFFALGRVDDYEDGSAIKSVKLFYL